MRNAQIVQNRFRASQSGSAALKHRALRFEPLESRELLAVIAGGEIAASALYSSSADDVLNQTSASLAAAALPTGATQLATPKISSITGGGGTSHLVSWDAVSNASSYQLSYSRDGVTWNTVQTTETSATVGDLVPGENMRYRIRALGQGSYSASNWSNAKSSYVCPVDFDGDGFIGPGDRSVLSAAWFSMQGSANWNPACDLDGDGFVGPGDLSYLSSVWFKSTGQIVVTSLGLAFDGEFVSLVNTEGADFLLRKGDTITIGEEEGKPYYTETLSANWEYFDIADITDPGDYTFYVTVSRPGALYGWKGSISFTVEDPEVQPSDLTAALAWDSTNYGLALTWTAKNAFRKDAVIDLYFASGSAYSGIVGSSPVSVTIPAGTAAGNSGTILIDGSSLYTTTPSNTFDTIVACLGNSVIASVADVSLRISSSVVTSVVSQSTYDAIKYGCRSVGLNSLLLTSGGRTPTQQASAMFSNMARADVKSAIANQYSIYSWTGDQVIAVFEQQAIAYDYNQSVILSHKSEIVALMTNKINELQASGYRVSNHCVTEANYIAHNIMDVSRGPFNSSNIPVITAALKKMGCTKVLDEPSNGCLHLEF